MQAVPASSLGLDRLVAIWNAAYAGYFVPMSWGVGQLARHLTTGSVDLDRSLVWLDGSDPIALSLLGVRPDELGTTASAHPTGAPESSAQKLSRERGWIGGFGIAPSHRGRGLSAVLMGEQLAAARSAGVSAVQLEVLTQNWAARSYERAGFVTTRRLSVLQGHLTASESATRQRPDWLDPGTVPDLAAQLGRLHAAYPAAWTREPPGALAFADDLRCAVVGPVEDLDALALVREEGGVLQVVDTAARDEPAAHALVAALASMRPGHACRVVNEPDDSPLRSAFEAHAVREVLAQHEMRWSA